MKEQAADAFASQPIIALEINELSDPLLQLWMGEGLLPNFQALWQRSAVFTTCPDGEDATLLEPWIQWYSIHTGRPYSEHKVFQLTDGKRADFPDIFTYLHAAGLPTMSFFSMNIRPFSVPGSVFLSDPWSEAGDAFPRAWNAFGTFVGHQVREHSRDTNRGLFRRAVPFVTFMLRNGLRPRHIKQILLQFMAEMRTGHDVTWRRAALLDVLQLATFRACYGNIRPKFATFFSNNIAHLQHRFWRHMAPDDFVIKPSAAEREAYGNAIRYGYQATDALVGEFIKLAESHGARLMLISAMSQQPFLKYEDIGGQRIYRLRAPERFLASLGVSYSRLEPVMAHQYRVRCSTEAEAQQLRARLSTYMLADGTGVFGFSPVENDSEALYFGCQIARHVMPDEIIFDDEKDHAEIGNFSEFFYQIEGMKSGRHHPDGSLWIETGRHARHEEKVSVLNILPTTLDLLGVSVPLGGVSLSTFLR